MIEFSLAYALAVILFSAFIPGAILALAILKKSDFASWEKIIAGFAFGWILQGALPFFEFIFLGMKFSYELALANTALLYIISLALFFWRKAYEDFIPQLDMKDPIKYVIPALVILLFVINVWLRLQTLGPIFQELDPYYYLYVPQQIIVQGFNPLDDQTAWYPILSVSHRNVPVLSYMEATWYSLYSQGGAYNNYLLSIIGNIYPPFAAAFAAFFIYLGLRSWYKVEYAFIASAVMSFVPMLVIKLMAGEAEVQAYAFFALSMFIGFYLWAQKKQDLKYTALAGLGYFATSTGSSSEVVAVVIVMLFTAAQAITLFLTKRDLGQFLKMSAVFLVFPLLAALTKGLFISFAFSYMAANVSLVLLIAALYILQKSKLEQETQFYALGGLALLGIVLFAFTPLGSLVKGIALTGLQVAEYSIPLQRTIAEQGTTGSVLEPSLGFIGMIFDDGLKVFAGYLFILPSLIANGVFALLSEVLDSIFGTSLNYNFKDNSVIMAILFFSMAASAYGLYKLAVKKEDNPAWLFIALIFPIALVGLIKAKYIIYLGYVASISIALILGELEAFINEFTKLANQNKKYLYYAFIALGTVTIVLQFSGSLASPLLASSTMMRFQDNPAAFADKLSGVCDDLKLKGVQESQIEEICAAGKDPIAYANAGINNQYDSQLCMISLFKDPLNPSQDDQLAASYRCERVTSYWVESMEWIRYHTENDSRITSWWDYGHWENFFGQRDAVIRNEHLSPEMIGAIAHDFIIGTPDDLKADMVKFDSKYALFDSELLFSGSSFGGKYGALNYLACAHDNQTDVNKYPGSSTCEFDHLWSQVYISANPTSEEECSISFNQKGITAYAAVVTQTGNGISYQLEPRYCAGITTLANGQNTTALYESSSRSSDGNLKLHRAFLKSDGTSRDGKWKIYTLLYTQDSIWISENGSVSDGWADRTGKFYDSNMYKAFVLESLPGFDLVYKTSDSQVKIFKIK